MNKLMVMSMAAAAIVASLTTPVEAAESKFKATDATMTTRLCMAALTDSRARMYFQMKDAGLSKRYIGKHVKCNGEKIANFAYRYGAYKTANQILGAKNKVSITDLAKQSARADEIVDVKGS